MKPHIKITTELPTFLVRCDRCGLRFSPEMPCSLERWKALVREFEGMHGKCGERTGEDEEA